MALDNAEALKVDAQTGVSATVNPTGPRYYLHNYLFGLGGAMMAGDRGLALKYADHAAPGFAKSDLERRTTAQARSLVALGRFAPDRALALAEGPSDLRILKIYRHYARGEAFKPPGRRGRRRPSRGRAITSSAVEATTASETGKRVRCRDRVRRPGGPRSHAGGPGEPGGVQLRRDRSARRSPNLAVAWWYRRGDWRAAH